MRFAISGGLFPHHIDEFTPAMAERTRQLGFTGIFTRFDADDPFATTEAQAKRVRQILDDYGLDMVQAIGHRPTLIHPDESARKEAVRTLQAAVRIAGWLRAQTCHTGPGSIAQVEAGGGVWSPYHGGGGAWSPHPENWSLRSRERLVESLREAAKTAEDCGTIIGLEGHVLVTLNSAEVMREVIDHVGSPAVRCDFDPVNWVTLATVYETGPAIERMIDTLGPERIVNVHAKDVVLEDRLVTHIDERPAGQGVLDFRTLMRRIEMLGPDRYLVVEHCSVEEIPAVRAFLGRVADELGIRVF